jgi:isopentenyl phosphate kinase
MARPVVFLKLGGSLITDKARPGVARHAVLRRLAREVAAIANGARGARVLLGHGSGSYGHPAAAGGGLTPGADARGRLDAISRTQHAAAGLHHLVIAALQDAGARPFSFAPSSFLSSSGGRVSGRFTGPIFSALNRGLLPVVYGDVVLDDARGAVVLSTEALFLLLAKEAAARRILVSRAVWLGETDGVHDSEGITIETLTPSQATRVARRVNGASGIDVTGGMALRLRAAGTLASAGVPSIIIDGRRAGALEQAVRGLFRRGTRVSSR